MTSLPASPKTTTRRRRTYREPTPASENIDALIDKAREEMERAAKSLDFLAAAKFRDRMYELQKLREENRNQNSQFTIHNS